ncbi:MAG TPA: hypothetical protein VFY29_13515 [Terriglobia bacterium]|nr:hypothetical protein [Terriglobia bacterium]
MSALAGFATFLRNSAPLLWLSVFLLAFSAVAAGSTQDLPRQALDRKLAQYPGASGGEIVELDDPAVRSAFPGYTVYALRFRMYPVARAPQPPLEMNNIFWVNRDRTVDLATDVDSLRPLFSAALGRVDMPPAAERAVRAWLRLVQELRQDGFFRFSAPEVAAAPGAVSSGDFRVSGTVAVVPNNGDKGQIASTLVFDRGRLVSTTDRVDLKAGIRPICQATKLLDPDPIVRGMAEQSILVMGQSAREYLQDQRAAASPELQRAIDRIWKRILDEGR